MAEQYDHLADPSVGDHPDVNLKVDKFNFTSGRNPIDTPDSGAELNIKPFGTYNPKAGISPDGKVHGM